MSVFDTLKMRLLRWNLGPKTPASLDRVIVPLEDAHLHSYAARMNRGNRAPHLSADDGDDEEDEDVEAGAKSSHEESRMLEMNVPEYSIKGLRREAQEGSKVPLTDYESMLPRSEGFESGADGCPSPRKDP